MCSVRFGAFAHDPHRVFAGIQPLAFVRNELLLDVGVCILRTSNKTAFLPQPAETLATPLRTVVAQWPSRSGLRCCASNAKELHRLCTCWLAKGTNPLANFFKPRLAQSHTTVVIPLYKRVVFVRLLNCSEFSSRLSEISQTLDAITGIQFRVGSRGLDERWPLGSVCVSRCSNV